MSPPRDEAPSALAAPGGAGRLAALAAQLALLWLALHVFQLENPALRDLAALAFGGALVNAVLPAHRRMPFFLGLSLAGIALVMGASGAAWVIGLGLALVGACHLPAPFWARVGIVAAIAAALAAARAGALPSPVPAAVWPVLGSLFMFRLIVYLYDLKHGKAPVGVWQRLAYFFLLPNVVFPLFPVVDSSRFRLSYYDGEAFHIYQSGARWILRGVVHLLAYRFIYYHLTLGPSEVASPGDMAQFVVANYLLYLRVSGQFHIAVGILKLYGFNLPETHHLYLLSSSINDFWRRINIYWKDFMLRLFYTPAFLKLRRGGETGAIVGASVLVFAATWMLHSYQWFWLRGSFPLIWQDAVFWTVLGALVIVNSLWENRRGRRRRLKAARPTLGQALGGGLATGATFTFMAILWSLWTSETIGGWLSVWTTVGGESPATAALSATLPLFAVAAAAGVVGTFWKSLRRRSESAFWPSALANGAVAAALLVAALPAVHAPLGARVTAIVDDLKQNRLSRVDTALMEKGYYEGLMRVERFNSQLWEIYARRPEPPRRIEEKDGPVIWDKSFLLATLRPNARSIYVDQPFDTNRWGMRDRDYDLAKPPHTFRAAVMGASHVLGHGVANGEPFEEVLEDKLNAELRGERYARYELLNFSLGAYTPLHHLYLLDTKVFDFEPDAVWIFAQSSEKQFIGNFLVKLLRQGGEIPYPYLQQVLEETGAIEARQENVIRNRIGPRIEEIVDWAYREIVARCRERGVEPVWIFLPKVREEPRWANRFRETRRSAEAAGFTALDLLHVYRRFDHGELWLGEWDNHPNAFAHRELARRLYNELARSELAESMAIPPQPALERRND